MIRNPSAVTFAVLSGAVLIMLLSIFAVRRWLVSRQSPARRKTSTRVKSAEFH
jgi:hypothetical protein